MSCFMKVIMDKNPNMGRERTIKNLPSECRLSPTFFPSRYVFCVTEVHLRDPAIIIYTKMVDRKLAVLVFHVQELSIAKEQGDRAEEERAYNNLGDAYIHLGDFQQAIECYTKSLNIAKEQRNRAGEGRAYNNLGDAYLSLGDFQQAIEYYTQSLSIAQEIGYKEWEGVVSRILADAYYFLDDFQKAIEYYTKSLSFSKGVGGGILQAIIYHNLGFSHYSLGECKQAIECHKKSISIAKALGDRAHEGRAYGNLGIAHSKLGNFKQAIECHRQQLSIAREVGDRAEEGRAYGNLGIVNRGMGNFKQAIEYLEQDLSIAKELRDREGEGVTYGNLGKAYFCLGYLKQAVEYHKQHLNISKEVGDRAGEGRAYCNLGSDYHGLGNFRLAIEYHKQHLAIVKEIGDRAGEGTAYCNLGSAYNNLRKFKQAIEYQKKHLSIAIDVGSKVGEGTAYCWLGDAYQHLGDFEKAEEYYKQYLSITKEIGDRAGEGKAQKCLGDALLFLGNFKHAIEYHKISLSIAKEVGDVVEEGDAYCSLGLDYEMSASFSEAIDCYQSSIRVLEKTRILLQSEDAWKRSFRDIHQIAYTALWRTLLKNGKPYEALCAAEQGRAQALMDMLKTQYAVDSKPSASDETNETISKMLNDLTTHTVFLALDESVHQDTIRFWVLRKGREVLSLQKEIEHGDASMLMEDTLKKIGAGDRVKCENRSMDELTDDRPSTRESIGEKDQPCIFSVDSLRPLYDAIIGPIADLLHGDQLVIVPDGPLCLAPYSALSESIKIRVVPSLSSLQLIAGAPDDFHRKSGALLVGDPCLDEVPMNLSQLPYAKKEVEMIGKLLKTTPLTGKDATKDKVVKRLKSVALVHIAAHGCAQSGEIVLALDLGRKSQPLRRQDFILTMSDVQAVCLRARLVVLSCCHSGRGEIKSEGVVGIARSFLCAGARSVLVSLWAIDDEATMVFMESFYQHLADGKSASVALHQAMKSLRKSEEFSAVNYWAPFVLIGDDVTLEFGEKK